RIHENATHGIDDQRALAVLCVDQRGAAAGRAFGIVEWPDQPWRAFDEHQRLALIPGMIAESDRICAGIYEIIVDDFGNAEAAGGVLAIDHDKIELPLCDQARKPFEHNGASGTADDVADKKNAHALQVSRKSNTSRSVSTRSSRASRSVAGTC